MPDRRRLTRALVALVLAGGLAHACTSDGAEPGADTREGDGSLLGIREAYELREGRSVVVARFVDDVTVSDEVYDLEGTRYVGAEVELCGFSEQRRRAFWRLTTDAGDEAVEAPLPRSANRHDLPPLDLYGPSGGRCAQGWLWFTVPDEHEAARLSWDGADAAVWDVSG